MEEYINKKNDLLDELKNVSGQNSVKEMISIHKDILNRKETVLNANAFKALLKKLENAEDCADDLEIKHLETELICPFQQKKIVNPFKNHCGHSYERDGLEKFVRTGYSQCPYTGCDAIVRLR